MITCSICGLQNDEFAVLCSSCKSYLQSKVDNLNLFETIWQLIESPELAFRKIVLARHKNYVFLLSSLVGISVAFAMFWMMHLGNRFPSLLFLTSAGALAGVPSGVALTLFLSALLAWEIRIFRGRVRLRDSWAVLSYSGIPIILSLVFIFPLEVAIFGIDFFGTNPPPLVINPGVYMALVGFDGLAIAWTVFLLHKGVRVISGFKRLRSSVVTVTIVLFSALLLLGAESLVNLHS